MAASSRHCRIATERWEPSEIVRTGVAVVPRQNPTDRLPIHQCGLGYKVVALRAGSR